MKRKVYCFTFPKSWYYFQSKPSSTFLLLTLSGSSLLKLQKALLLPDLASWEISTISFTFHENWVNKLINEWTIMYPEGTYQLCSNEPWKFMKSPSKKGCKWIWGASLALNFSKRNHGDGNWSHRSRWGRRALN